LSETSNISSNILVNQIIKLYLDWYSTAAHAKLYYLPKSFLVRSLSELKKGELNELARETAKKDLVDIRLFLKGEFSVASISILQRLG
jgi:hypothetical protein